MSQIFRNTGFELHGNIVWFKGEIEGKRNYNQGNRAPYYQLPLNSWEHILVFRKPGSGRKTIEFPSLIYCQPVKKMFNGENRHGHTAPFPIDIPKLLCDRLDSGSSVLDPYGGSFTTALACQERDQQCTIIELHTEYCQLGLSRVSETNKQLELLA